MLVTCTCCRQLVSVETTTRFMRLREAHRRWARTAWIGALVTEFNNDELRLLSDNYFSIADTHELRRRGLLRDDEGYDGGADRHG